MRKRRVARLFIVVMVLALLLIPLENNMRFLALEIAEENQDIYMESSSENEQIYVGDFNLYTFRADRYLEEGSVCNNIIKDTMNVVSPSDIMVEILDRKSSFQNSVAAWKLLHYATSPSEIAEGGIDEKGYYTAIILSVFKAQTQSDTYIYDSVKEVNSNTNKVLSNIKKWIKESDAVEISAISRNQILSTMSINDQKAIREQLVKEFKTNHPILNASSTFADDLNTILDAVDTLGEGIELMQSYVQILELSNSMKAVLQEMYYLCPSSNATMKSALYEAALATENLACAVGATISNVAGEESYHVLGVLLDEGWKKLISLNPYAKAFMIGAEVGTWLGDSICNTLFSTDKSIEQYQKMKCLSEFTELLKTAVTNFGTTYSESKTTEYAENYFAAIRALFSAMDLSCDFAEDYASIIYKDASIGWLAVSKVEYEEYVKSVNSLRGYYAGYENSLVINYLADLEHYYPDIYGILMGLDEEDPIPVTSISFEQEEIVIGLEDAWIFHVGVLDVVPYNATNQNIYYESSNEEVVGVDDDYGWLSPRKVGTAYITATSKDGGYTDTITVHIVEGRSESWAAIDVARVVDYGMCGESAEWVFYDNGLLEISGSGKMEDYDTTSYRPWGNYHSSITSVKISDGIEHIGNNAFQRNKILTVEFPEDLESIGKYAFAICDSLTKVEFPDSLESIGACAFQGCGSLTAVEFPDGLGSIGVAAFSNCGSLSTIKLPDSLQSIGKGVFSGCGSLTTVEFSESLQRIEADAFRDCVSLTTIKLPNDLLSIGEAAFIYCDSLTTIEFSDGLQSIGDYAFSDCYALKSVELPNSLKSIGEAAFHRCNNLLEVEFSNGLESIGADAFLDCTSLTAIKLPNGLESIGEGAFSGCGSLTTVEFSDGLQSIGAYAFSNCNALVSVELPNGLESIGEGVFSGCISLSTIGLPDSLESIGNNAFFRCDSLIAVELPDTLRSIEFETFMSCFNLTVIEFPDNLQIIGERAFYNCDNLITVELSDGLQSIGEDAFGGCFVLESIIIPDSVNYIAADAFSGLHAGEFVIYCTSNSYAKIYAEESGINYILTDSFEQAEVTLSSINFVYDGTEKKPMVTVKIGNKVLVEGKDYILTGDYSVIDVGDYIITVEGIGLYTGKMDIPYRVTPAENTDEVENAYTITFNENKGTNLSTTSKTVKENQVIGELPKVERDGYTFKGWYTSASGGTSITENTIITGDVTFYAQWEKIIVSIETATIELSTESFVYDGTEKQPIITVKIGNKTLTSNTDYTISYTDNVAVGTATITLTGKGNYTGTVKQNYVITAASIKDAKVTLSTTDYTYNGKAKKPSVTIMLGDRKLVKDTDYTVSYKNNKNIGTATVTIEGKGNYIGTIEKTFTIKVKKGATFTSGNYKYEVTGTSTVAFAGIKSTKTEDVTIVETVKYGGKTFKVTSIADKALKDKKKVVKVTIGTNVKNIGASAFYGCKSLKTITINTENLGKIGAKAFKGIHVKAVIKVPVKKYSSYKKLLENKGMGDKVSIIINAKKGDTFTSGSNKYKVTGTSTVAFAGLKNTKTTKVTIPKTVKYGGKSFKVTSVADTALKGKKKVTQVTIGENVTSIGTSAFEGCKNLKTITIKSTKLKTVGKEAFKKINSKAIIKVPKSKLTSYKKLLKDKGQGSKVKIVKYN